ncbi:MAG: hypothetical protein ACR2HX_03420 [Pyrinomonadaceae bacterium]
MNLTWIGPNHLNPILVIQIPIPPSEILNVNNPHELSHLYEAKIKLFESHLQSVFTQRGKEWVDSTIGAEIRFIDYRGKTPVKTPSGIRLITAKNVKMGYLQGTPMEFIAAASYKGWMTRGIPKKGDSPVHD